MSEESSTQEFEPALTGGQRPEERRSPMAEEATRRLQAGRTPAGLAPSRLPAAAPAPRRPWRPLLDGDLADQARATVLEIAEALRDREPEPSGPCGLALLFGYLARAEVGSVPASYASISQAFLDRAVARTGAQAGLYTGFVGTAWTVEHLRGGGARHDGNRALDELLRQFLRTTPWPGEFDLIVGLAGLGLYALARVRRSIARQCLALVVDRLAEEAQWRDDGVTWLSKPALMIPESRAVFPLGYYNCGVGHGVPAVALVLAGACRAGVNVKRARPLLDGVMHWLLSNRLEASSASAFPCWVTVEERPRVRTRSAWCYGDPGVAATLLAVARAVGDTTWEGEALAVARHASARPMDDCGVADAGLCHGAAGLATLYNRMWQTTGDEALRASAIRWCQRTLELRRVGVGVAGFQTYFRRSGPVEDPDPWVNDITFLNGVSGTALALLAAISDVEPAWDAVLAASLPAAA